MSATKKQWTFDEVQALIHAVRKNPSLYDRRDPDYNQIRTKEVRGSRLIHSAILNTIPLNKEHKTNLTVHIFRIFGRIYHVCQQSMTKIVSDS